LFRFMSGAFTRNRVAGGRTLVAGAYGEATLRTGPWLLTGGARLDGWTTGGGHRIETDRASGHVTFQDHPDDRSGTVLSGRVGVRRDLTDGLYLRAAAYSGFRPPTLNELYRPFRVGNDITEANAALKPERLYGVEGGFGGSEGRLTWEVTGFYNRLKDAVTNVTVGAGPGTVAGFPGAGFIPAGGVLRQRRNAGAIDGYGVEANAAYVLSQAVRVHASAGYTHAEVDGGTQAPQLTGLRPAQTPRFTGTVGLDVSPIERLQLHGDLRYEGARFDDDQNSRRLAGATRVDLRADLGIGRGAGLFAAVDNVFDSRIETARTADNIVSYDMPRVFSVGLTLRR